MSRPPSRPPPRSPRAPRRTRSAPPARPAGSSGSDSGGRLRLYGRHPVQAALANPARPLHRLWATADVAPGLAAAAGDRGLSVEVVERTALDALLPPDAVHQGQVLEAGPLPAPALDDLVPAGPDDAAVVLVLDQVTDPRNVGALLRAAAAFGARAVITQDRHAPPDSGALAKAASGALEHVPLVRVPNLARALDALRAAGFWTVGLAADAPLTLAGAGLTGPLALVLGAEGAGLRRLTRTHCDHLVRLPMDTRAVDSLNVASAGAVALYEVRRPALEAAAPP